MITKSGGELLLGQNVQLIMDGTQVVGFQAVARDVSDRKQAEEAIRTLATRVSAAEDAERRRLAQDLHDSVGQDLTALRLMLEAMAERVRNQPEGQAQWREACALVDRVILQTRSLTGDLYPAILDDFGLVPALLSHAAQYTQHTGIQVSVSEVDVPRTLPTALANFLYRAVKELINNAAKHGPARQVLVQLRGRDAALRVIVDDDGRGLPAPGNADASAPKLTTGLGLAWIRERLRTMGGELMLESNPGSGARVILYVPIAPEVPTAAKESP